jgi:hypothetical protein
MYGVSGWSIAIVVVALVLLAVAAVSFLTHHRLLVGWQPVRSGDRRPVLHARRRGDLAAPTIDGRGRQRRSSSE